MKKLPLLISCSLLCIAQVLSAQQAQRGPVIEDFGPTYSFEELDYRPNPNHTYQVIFDIATGAEDPAAINKRIETLARFYNMHVTSGVPLEKLKPIAVLHGTAAKDALNRELYQDRYGVPHPNARLIKRLVEAGAEIYLCAQSAGARDLPIDQLLPDVKLALSAMTVLIDKQGEGYRLIRF